MLKLKLKKKCLRLAACRRDMGLLQAESSVLILAHSRHTSLPSLMAPSLLHTFSPPLVPLLCLWCPLLPRQREPGVTICWFSTFYLSLPRHPCLCFSSCNQIFPSLLPCLLPFFSVGKDLAGCLVMCLETGVGFPVPPCSCPGVAYGWGCSGCLCRVTPLPLSPSTSPRVP